MCQFLFVLLLIKLNIDKSLFVIENDREKKNTSVYCIFVIMLGQIIFTII